MYIQFLGALLFLSPSLQHFIWPLSYCLLADICNHTWIPECGQDNKDARLFIDECDMYEYNCDYEREYEVTNYTECFKPATGCPTAQPCPAKPPCKNKTLRGGVCIHNMLTARRNIPRKPPVTLPMRMLRGKRRYTPKKRNKLKKRHRVWKPVTRLSQKIKTPTTVQTVILKRETIIRSGKKLMRVVKGVAWQAGKPLKIVAEDQDPDSGFLQ